MTLHAIIIGKNAKEALYYVDSVKAIGTAKFKIIRTCPPCRYLSRLLGEDMMSGLKYIGGYRASIVESGVIGVGDEVQVL